jgi:hypothetical protein
MKTIKPQKLGLLTRTFESGDACYFAVLGRRDLRGPAPARSRGLRDADGVSHAVLEADDEPWRK